MLIRLFHIGNLYEAFAASSSYIFDALFIAGPKMHGMELFIGLHSGDPAVCFWSFGV